MTRFLIEVPHEAQEAACARHSDLHPDRLPFPGECRLGLLGRRTQGVDDFGGREQGRCPVCSATVFALRSQDREAEQVHDAGCRGIPSPSRGLTAVAAASGPCVPAVSRTVLLEIPPTARMLCVIACNQGAIPVTKHGDDLVSASPPSTAWIPPTTRAVRITSARVSGISLLTQIFSRSPSPRSTSGDKRCTLGPQ